MHWPAPVVTQSVEDDAGPVMVTVEYRIAPKDRDAFLSAMKSMGAERKRDGAYAWGIFENTAEIGCFVETFFVESWMEHLRQHRRVTHAARVLEQQVRKYSLDPPVVTHFIAAEPGKEQNAQA